MHVSDLSEMLQNGLGGSVGLTAKTGQNQPPKASQAKEIKQTSTNLPNIFDVFGFKLLLQSSFTWIHGAAFGGQFN